MFQVSNTANGINRRSHCSVLEFTAPEGHCYMPLWMMENLCVQSGNIIQLSNVTLQKGTFVKLRPHRTAFIDLPNPKTVLEQALRTFSCLTKGDTIVISPPRLGTFKLDIVEVGPQDQVCIIETDVVLEFEEPKDYSAHQHAAAVAAAAAKKKETEEPSGGFSWGQYDDSAEEKTAKPKATSEKDTYFSKLGGGARLSGKKVQKPTRPGGRGGALGRKQGATKKRKETVIVGNMEYVYEVDPATDERKLLRRIPIRDFGGSGYSLKKTK